MNREEIARVLYEKFVYIDGNMEEWLVIADWHIKEIEKAEKRARREVAGELKSLITKGTVKLTKNEVRTICVIRANEIITANSEKGE